MKNALVAWESYPTTRSQGGPLDPADIAGVDASLSVDGGASWSAPVRTASPELSVPFNDLPFGDWIVKCQVVDNAGQASVGVDILFSIVDDSPPGEVVNVMVSLS